MLITKNRIKKLDQYIQGIELGTEVSLCIQLGIDDSSRAIMAGFTPELEVGEKVLPAVIGKTTDFNANGKDIIQKDHPKETHFRQAEWRWKEFKGRYDFEERSKIVEVPYKRYPRKHIDAPSIELEITTSRAGAKLVSSNTVNLLEENHEAIIHTINLILEIFGRCELRQSDHEPIIKAKTIRLNWQVLPPGRRPWPEMKIVLDPIIKSRPNGVAVVIEKRFEAINAYNPSFIAVGQAGFTGYLIFGFPEKNLYILESTEINNATYLLEDNWEHISSLSKAEIIVDNLHKKRVVHRKGWFKEINISMQ